MPNRLTLRTDDGVALFACRSCKRSCSVSSKYIKEAIEKLATYEETGLFPEVVQEIATAFREGLLVILPPIQNAEIFIIEEYEKDFGETFVSNKPVNYFDTTGLYCGHGLAQVRYDFADINIKWFLTREAAEAGLR